MSNSKRRLSVASGYFWGEDVMRIKFEESSIQTIKEHEKRLLKTYSEIVGSFSSRFEKLNCTLEVGLFWSDELKNSNSDYRIPFQNGYSCYVFCEVKKYGSEVRIKSNDDEADYYPLSDSWIITRINRSFSGLVVSLYSNTKPVIDCLYKLSLKLEDQLKRQH